MFCTDHRPVITCLKRKISFNVEVTTFQVNEWTPEPSASLYDIICLLKAGGAQSDLKSVSEEKKVRCLFIQSMEICGFPCWGEELPQ